MKSKLFALLATAGTIIVLPIALFLFLWVSFHFLLPLIGILSVIGLVWMLYSVWYSFFESWLDK